MNLRITFMIGASIIGLFLVGCQRPVGPSEFPGKWVPTKVSQQKWIKGTNSCQLILNGDGTMAAAVPDYLLTAPDKSSGKVMSGTGRWAIQQDQLKLNFVYVDGARINWGGQPLQVQRRDKTFELFFYVGEEGGERFVFQRAPGVAAEK